jgi:hypothetical protein
VDGRDGEEAVPCPVADSTTPPFSNVVSIAGFFVLRCMPLVPRRVAMLGEDMLMFQLCKMWRMRRTKESQDCV